MYCSARMRKDRPPDAIGGRRGCALQECDGARHEVKVILEERWRIDVDEWARPAVQATAAKRT
jgi:hypothetical protein